MGMMVSPQELRAVALFIEGCPAELASIQVGDDYYSLELNYEGGIAFSVDAVNLLSDAIGSAGAFDLETLQLRLPLVAYGDVRYDVILQYDGTIYVAPELNRRFILCAPQPLWLLKTPSVAGSQVGDVPMALLARAGVPVRQ